MTEALTAESDYVAQFPEYFLINDQETGFPRQIKEPTYQILSECFLGDTIWYPGEPITTGLCPNYEMLPLNKAAAINMEKWLDTLPGGESESITIGEHVEASMMVRNHPDVEKLSHEQLSKLVLKTVLALRKQRGATGAEVGGGRGRMALPQIDARRAASAKVPPMPNANFKDLPHGMARPGAAMGNMPRQARGR